MALRAAIGAMGRHGGRVPVALSRDESHLQNEKIVVEQVCGLYNCQFDLEKLHTGGWDLCEPLLLCIGPGMRWLGNSGILRG